MKRSIFVALVLPTVALAQFQEPLVGDRPDFTESAVTIESGHLQFEGGFSQTVADESRLTTLGELLIRFGVGQNTEGRLTLGSFAWLKNPPFTNADGTTDMALGAKHRFFRNAGLVPETALLATVTLPSGADGVSFEEVIPVLVGAFGWELSSVFGLGANLGYSQVYIPEQRDRFNSWWGSLSLAATLGSRLGAFAEVYSYSREERDGDASAYADLGLTYLINPNFQLDARVGQGFNGLDENYVYGFGIVFRI